MVVASDDHAAAPSPRTMMDGGVGLGHGGQLPRCLPFVGAECDLMGLAAAEGGNAAAPLSGMRMGSAGDAAATGSGCKAALMPGARTGDVTNLAVASGDWAATPSPRTRTEGGCGLGCVWQLPRFLPHQVRGQVGSGRGQLQLGLHLV